MKIMGEKLYLLGLIIANIVVFILLIASEYIEEWFSYSKVEACSWKGSYKEIYSSKCYKHTAYGDSSCRAPDPGPECNCCSLDELVSMYDLKGNSICIVINFGLILTWIMINISLNIGKMLFSFEVYWKIYCGVYILLGIVSCFFTGSSHPVDVTLKAGYSLRLAGILIFYVVGLIHIFYCCHRLVRDRRPATQSSVSKELLETDRVEIKISEENPLNKEVTIQ